ncbi:hypothetical protein GWK47_029345 [Chionoecetes opilio]|uniref:Uncharacterized protein n=1 Tax=Chionoecetes opilio TaxID=41210 RepID=A0A8J5D224_CHIOP|nr:hypothetical protein GWK47_029345 [Chionoecetes opilio]
MEVEPSSDVFALCFLPLFSFLRAILGPGGPFSSVHASLPLYFTLRSPRVCRAWHLYIPRAPLYLKLSPPPGRVVVPFGGQHASLVGGLGYDGESSVAPLDQSRWFMRVVRARAKRDAGMVGTASVPGGLPHTLGKTEGLLPATPGAVGLPRPDSLHDRPAVLDFSHFESSHIDSGAFPGPTWHEAGSRPSSSAPRSGGPRIKGRDRIDETSLALGGTSTLEPLLLSNGPGLLWSMIPALGCTCHRWTVHQLPTAFTAPFVFVDHTTEFPTVWELQWKKTIPLFGNSQFYQSWGAEENFPTDKPGGGGKQGPTHPRWLRFLPKGLPNQPCCSSTTTFSLYLILSIQVKNTFLAIDLRLCGVC